MRDFQPVASFSLNCLMNREGYIFDAWFCESITDVARYRKRHQRDGLCHDCKCKAVQGGRCAKHHQAHILLCKKYREAMKAKKKAVCNVNTTML